jgi:hypothetical protein
MVLRHVFEHNCIPQHDMSHIDYLPERFPGQYAYRGDTPTVRDRVCTQVTIYARGPPALGLEHKIAFTFTSVELPPGDQSGDRYAPIITMQTRVAHDDERPLILSHYLPLLARDLSNLFPHNVTIDGLARIFDHDSPWSINSETLDARATHPYPIPYSIRSYSFRDDPATYKRTIHNPWEPDVIHGLPPILGEEIKVRCSYETHPPETFTLTRYDRTDEALALLPPRVRIPFDLFWGVTASKRLSHTQVAAKLKKKVRTVGHTIAEAYCYIGTKYARPVDVVNT